MNLNLLIRRFIAFVIDWNITFGVPIAVFSFAQADDPSFFIAPSFEALMSPGVLLSIAWIPLYFLFKDCLFGRRSLGKLICGLTIQSSVTGKKVSFGSLILRNITGFILVYVDVILVLANKGTRIGDMIAKTQVVRRAKG